MMSIPSLDLFAVLHVPQVPSETTEKQLKSTIRWSATRYYDGGDGDLIKYPLGSYKERKGYCDDEIKGKVSHEDIQAYGARAQELFSSITWIRQELPKAEKKIEWKGEQVPTEMYFMKSSDGKSRVEYWITREGYFIALELAGELCWVLGCMHGHPFVETNDWSFGNSDGSTDDSVLETWDSLISFMTQTTLEYVLEQVH